MISAPAASLQPAAGTTTIIPFAQQIPGMTLREAVIDYDFHMILSDPNEQMLGQELLALVADGYTSFKVYMTYDGMHMEDMQILDVLAAARETGAFIMDRPPSERRRTAPSRCRKWSIRRSSSCMSHPTGPWSKSLGRDRGLSVHAETCLLYLFFSSEDFSRPGWKGAKYICSSPPRGPGDADHLWRGIQNGVFQFVSSDHCPYRMEGPGGRTESAGELHFHKISPGLPGIEMRFPLLFPKTS